MSDGEPETIDSLTARHKKELKALEGEKRAALKNAKSMGKKAKAKIKEVEFKYEGLERDIKARHAQEVDALNNGGGAAQEAAPGDIDADNGQPAQETAAIEKTVTFDPHTNTHLAHQESQQTEEEIAALKKQKALSKKLKKKSAQKQKDLDRETRILTENASAGPSPRDLEISTLKSLYLTPRKLTISEVTADGNCLYRAIASQCLRLKLLPESKATYTQIRSLCADTLLQHAEEYEPFAELDHDANHPAENYDEYVRHVRETNTWGGQLELRALSCALKVPVVVFSAEGPPLTMGKEFGEEENDGDLGYGEKKAVLVSFHRYYYALGEHYNSVVPLEEGS
ncbi:hypothetical protein ACHAXN_010954 [Cyclotella atomus]